MTSSIESGSASSSSQTSFGLSNGLIEITALTSLIGSTSTQSLSLGNKGPAGFVWATMTIFSAATLVKTGISTVTPGWLRDTLGVRSPEADAAVGLSLNLESKGVRYRTRSGVAQAIECEVEVVAFSSLGHSQLTGVRLSIDQIRLTLGAEISMSLINAWPTS